MKGREDEVRHGAHIATSPPELLIEALHAEDEAERLQAARLLRERHTEDTIPALLTVLSDTNAGVRWLAGEALIRIGPASVVPLLGALVREMPDTWMIEETAHILRHLQLPQFGGLLGPVLAACEHSTRDLEVPVQAEVALLAISQLNVGNDS